MLATLATEYITFPNDQHGPQFFVVSASILPFLLVGIARSSLSRWGATAAAGFYMGITILMIWILQLFPAQPMLAPIMRQVTSMVPPAFPILLVFPALVIDFMMKRLPDGVGRGRLWMTAVGGAAAAMVTLGLVQWYFAEFLMSAGARNFFFGADQWDYNTPPGAWQYEYWGSPMTAGAGRPDGPVDRGLGNGGPPVGQLDVPSPEVACPVLVPSFAKPVCWRS